MRYTKHSSANSASDIWKIYSPNSDELLYTSPSGVDNTEVTDTFCLSVTPLLQYDLQMYSDNVNTNRQWSYDSWLSINGLYNHIAFKSDWRANRIRLSFYTPVDHEMSWFWTSNYSPDWKTCSTNSWSLTTGTSISSDSVIYFRRSFTGLSNMAAYESQFYYRDGIIAYLNGYEIYRDNMGTGPILPSSKPISSYSSYSYHGVIRNGYDVSESECILSVEIHLPQSVSIQFHSWLSIYASSHELSSSSICYPVAVEEVHNSYNLDMMPVADFNSSSFISFSSISTELFLVYQVPSSSVNSWRLLTSPTLCPLTSFDIQGRLDMKDEWSESNPSSSYTYSKVEYLTISVQHYNHHHYSSYKLIPREVMCFPSRMYELYPMVCHQPYSVSRSSSLFNERYEMTMGDTVNIVASNADAVGCMSDPSLPGGLAFHECSIVGSPTESVTDLMIQVYWQDDYGTMSQQVTISVTAVDIPKKKSSSLYFVLLGVIIVVLVILLWFGCRSKDKKGKLIRVHLDPPIPGPPIYEPPQSLKIGHKVPMNIGQSSSVDQSISSLNEGQYPQDSHRFSTPIQSSVSPSLGSTTVVSADPQKSPVSLSPSMQPQLSVAPYTSQSVQVPGLKVPSTMRSNDMSMMPSPGPSQSFTPSGRLVSAGNSSRVSVRCSKSTIVKDENGNDVDLESLPFHARLQYTKDSGA